MQVWATFAKTLWLQNGITEHKNFRSLSRGYSQCSGSQPEPTTDANNLMGIILTTMVHLVYSSLLSVLLCDVERVPNVGIEDIRIRNWQDWGTVTYFKFKDYLFSNSKNCSNS